MSHQQQPMIVSICSFIVGNSIIHRMDRQPSAGETKPGAVDAPAAGSIQPAEAVAVDASGKSAAADAPDQTKAADQKPCIGQAIGRAAGMLLLAYLVHKICNRRRAAKCDDAGNPDQE